MKKTITKKLINYSESKNEFLKETRGIDFKDIINVLKHKGATNDLNHPNQEKYPEQKMFVIEINEYFYLVPYVENENEIFLKTAFPSRKAFKKHCKEK